ncbi:patatin-like phospholipase family protein [Pseudanabaena biceps]|nr:patatin-like phospholipase family protein [Pseudanabaena biceps]
MSRKLAIAISGAVSLGSYESGVMYEMLEAISVHNRNLSDEDDRRVEIDVITGASAGGMTACMLAQHLLCDDGTLSDPYNNPLYNSWVRKVDILELLKVSRENQKYSLLDSNAVDKIGTTYIPDQPKEPHNLHPSAASKIQVGIAMSNLNGFTYDVPIRNSPLNSNSIGYTRYKDQFVCVVNRLATGEVTLMEKSLELAEEARETSWRDFRTTSWSELREIAISSGAFPLAFRAKAIFRIGAGKFLKRDSERQKKVKGDIDREGKFLYSDGGIFDNETIGLSKSLVDQTDQNNDSSNRYYLFVAPGKREAAKDPFLNRDDNLFTTAIGIFGAIFGQSRFQDWSMDILKPPVYSITSTDTKLIGDVFSAFAGFLEEKFRAYDYNIGRENARNELMNGSLTNLLTYDLAKMPPIEWKVTGEKGQIKGKSVKSWEEAKTLLSPFAEVIIDEKKKQRNQLKELQNLMQEVNKDTRHEIAKQLTSRLDYLIDFINDEYLKPLDKKNDGSVLSKLGSWLKVIRREWIGRPIIKIVLWYFLETWLEKNILHPSIQEKR